MTDSHQGWISKTRSLNPADYDRYRPDYPAELFAAIQQYIPVTPGTRCLEIGIGTGQATDPFLKMGCQVVALEPAENLRDYAQEKYRSRSNLEIRDTRFEDIPAEERFDLIYAATSFHWVKHDRMQLLRSHLAPGGCVALFWNHPAPDEEIHGEITEVYGRELPHAPGQARKRWQESEAAMISDELGAGGFDDVNTHIFHRDRVLSTSQYIGLLHTYSDHISLADEFREPLMRGIGDVIDAYGGHITIHDTIDLHLARAREDHQPTVSQAMLGAR